MELSFRVFLLLQQRDGDLDDGFFSFLLNLLHALAEMVLQVDGILLGVNIYLALLVEGL